MNLIYLISVWEEEFGTILYIGFQALSFYILALQLV